MNTNLKKHAPTIKDAIYGMAIGDILSNNSAHDSYSKSLISTFYVCKMISERKIIFDDNLALTILHNSTEPVVTGIPGLARLIPAAFLEGEDTSLSKYIPSLGINDLYDMSSTIEYLYTLMDIIYWDDVDIEDRILSKYSFIGDLIEDELPTVNKIPEILYSVYWLFIFTDSFEECIQKALRLKGDTKAISILVGALAGIYYGYEKMPEYMLDSLPKNIDLNEYLF